MGGQMGGAIKGRGKGRGKGAGAGAAQHSVAAGRGPLGGLPEARRQAHRMSDTCKCSEACPSIHEM